MMKKLWTRWWRLSLFGLLVACLLVSPFQYASAVRDAIERDDAKRLRMLILGDGDRSVYRLQLLMKGGPLVGRRTVLAIACEEGSEECIKMLLACGANPNLFYDGALPLDIPIWDGSPSRSRVMRLLLDAGADIHGFGTRSPISIAIREIGVLQFCELFVGVELTSEILEELDGLLLAEGVQDSWQGQFKCALRDALALSSDILATTISGYSDSEIEFLRKVWSDRVGGGSSTFKGSRPDTIPLTLMVSPMVSEDYAMYAIGQSLGVYAHDDFGWSPLHAVATSGYERAARELIATGCPIDTVNKAGDTALHVAVFCANWAICSILIESGASLDLESSLGQTARYFLGGRLHANLSDAAKLKFIGKQ